MRRYRPSPRWMNLWKATLSANIRRNVWRLSKLMIPMRGVPRPFVFSSEPGTYQAGVNLAVYASAWQTEADLADIFLHWNGTPTARTRSGSNARGRWRPASPQ
ncbi:MAG: cobaltochelatase subunit CobN [Bilophila wadsworthia]